ncbi:MAG: nitrogen regulation protein NR(II) [Gammaproteobacteria bacterium]|nr:nitrogen regulation protein NR(II) [Gammaproteobacteria bacterium]MBU1978278.1 nitrogen regulation protein NR(II) [Gammaproteobacteria bacterium]
MITKLFAGLEHLTTAVILLDQDLRVAFLNPSAENLFKLSRKYVIGIPLRQVFGDAETLPRAIESALLTQASFTEHEILLNTPGNHSLSVSCTVTPVDVGSISLILEFHQIDKQLKIAREERMQVQQQANRELLRNLAHEIKNPLGGLRGAAQLLEYELPRAGLREYTQVIIQEADRLQKLMDRLLTPSHLPHLRATNIHEVLERVRSLTLAETPKGITIRRDYDTSLPDLVADPEQLIQAVLNIVRNAVQSMQGKGEIILRTRIARQVTLVKKRYRQAIQLQIIDNGPGIPDAIREKIFYPLVSGREGGSGMGLTLAQTLINQHQGTIECDSRPGCTCFTLLLPLTDIEGVYK